MFDRRDVDRLALWRRWLVDDPQGWRPGGQPGSVGYAPGDLAAFGDDNPVLLFVGRYTAVKRIPLLVRAYARARERFDRPAPLVLLGGYPGEWEGEHPVEAIARCGLEKEVFVAGWHEHELLPEFFGASDAVVLPSVREQFGQVLVEGMACGLPAIAVDAHGPGQIVDHGATGWLVEPDDEEALADVLVEAVNDSGERRRRGEAARDVVRDLYSWPALAGRVADVYDACL
jgi:glycosyltransferase involved in cell wall biosynthesis